MNTKHWGLLRTSQALGRGINLMINSRQVYLKNTSKQILLKIFERRMMSDCAQFEAEKKCKQEFGVKREEIAQVVV